MPELAAIYELVGRAGSYADLRFSTDTADPDAARCSSRVQERGDGDRDDAAVLRARVGGAADERADELLAADGLDFARHYLRSARRYRPHLLSEPEERLAGREVA